MATYVGDDGNNSYQGGAAADTIIGEAGYDTLGGGAGADSIEGGDDQDLISSGKIIGHSEWRHSYYYFDPIVPELDRGTEHDTLKGGAGFDIIFAGYGDVVDGGADGALLLLSLRGATSGVTADFNQLADGGTMTIGGGTISNLDSITIIEGTDFADNLTAQAGNISGQVSPDMFGFGGNDVLISGYYTSNLYGGDGDDTLEGPYSGYGGYYYGEAGNDLIRAKGLAQGYGGDGNDTIEGAAHAFGGIGDDILIVGENPYGADYLGDEGNDLLVGGQQDDALSGGAGEDTLKGDIGNDALYSGDFSGDPAQELDILEGGDGNDYLSIGYGDHADGGAGYDILEIDLSAASTAITIDFARIAEGFTIGGSVVQNIEQVVKMKGSAFDDTITLSSTTQDLTSLRAFGGGGNDHLEALSGQVSLYGESGNDTLIGASGQDSLDGGDGNDVLDGGFGEDELNGGFGDDFYRINSIGDRIYDYEGGNDTVESKITYVLSDLLENLILVGNALDGTGNIHANMLTGNARGNLLNGMAGADTMSGGLGDDIYVVDDTGDIVVEVAGEGLDTVRTALTHYKLASHVEILEYLGSASAALVGNGLANTITGGRGDDTLDGGAGIDRAIFSGNLADYRIVFEDKSYRVTDLRAGTNDGSDLLTNVERLVFADGEVTPLPLPGTNLDFRLVTMSGFVGGVSGYGTVFGTNDFEDIAILDGPASIALDASFARGGDVLRLPGNAGDYQVSISGSNALLAAENFAVTVPIGSTGLPIVFADGVRTLVYDAGAGGARIGAQLITQPAQIAAPPDGAALPDHGDPAVAGRLILFPDIDAPLVAAGKLNVFGTNGSDEVTLDKGSFVLDASFARGGDTIHLLDPASDFRAHVKGSNVVLTSSDTTITIPIGASGVMLDFAGTELRLRYDGSADAIRIGSQAIIATSLETADPLGPSTLAVVAQSFA
ncbi:MAG: calcium-binding protein [Sphingobium sp.]